MSPKIPCENNKFDAACRIVDHTHTTYHPALVRVIHLLLGKTINTTLQIRHTVDKCDIGYLFCYVQ